MPQPKPPKAKNNNKYDEPTICKQVQVTNDLQVQHLFFGFIYLVGSLMLNGYFLYIYIQKL